MIRNPSIDTTEARPAFWSRDLGYPHAFLTVVWTLILGLAMHLWVGYDWLGLIHRYALLAVLVIPLLGFAVWCGIKPQHRIVRWFCGIPFAMVVFAPLSIIAAFGGTFPEATWARFGLVSLWQSWPFVLTSYLLLLNLMGSCARRLWPLTYRNFVFQTTHLGLAVTLIGGAYGAMGLERYTMVLFEGIETEKMTCRAGHEHKAPFAVTLRDFRMETFDPKLTFAIVDENAPGGMRQIPGSMFVREGLTETINNIRVEVLRYLPKAAFDGFGWREVAWPHAPPAAFIRATLPSGEVKEGWAASGNVEFPNSFVMVGEKSAIIMPDPRPRSFESTVTIRGKDYEVAVNAPLKIDGFDVYQFAYDEEMGALSSFSVIELVYDPALYIVLGGIYVMLLSGALHLWNGIGGRL